MRSATAHDQGKRPGAVHRAAVVVAALYLALVQMLSAAHAASGEASVPDHGSSTCVYCLASDRNLHPVAEEAAVVSEPVMIGRVAGFVSLPAREAAERSKPPSRGPPAVI